MCWGLHHSVKGGFPFPQAYVVNPSYLSLPPAVSAVPRGECAPAVSAVGGGVCSCRGECSALAGGTVLLQGCPSCHLLQTLAPPL